MCNNHNDHNHDHNHQKPVEPGSLRVLFERYKEPGVTEELRAELNELHALPAGAEFNTRFEQLSKKYPAVASLQTSLAMMYAMDDNTETAEKIFKKALADFPQDTLVKTTYAGYLLRKGDFDAIGTLFNHTFDLKALYPERAEFYAIEVLEFYGTVGLYYAAKDKRAEAYNCLMFIRKIDPQAQLVQALEKILGVPSENDPHYAQFYKLLKKERNKVRTK